MAAVRSGHASAVEFLLRKGADPALENEAGCSAIHLAQVLTLACPCHVFKLTCAHVFVLKELLSRSSLTSNRFILLLQHLRRERLQAAKQEVILRLLVLKQIKKLTAATLEYVHEHDRMLQTFNIEKEQELQQVCASTCEKNCDTQTSI